MPAQSKAFSDLQWRQRNRVVGTVFEIFEAHCPSVADATMLMDKVFKKCSSWLPISTLQTQFVAQLVASLGSIRTNLVDDFPTSRRLAPAISVAQLDSAVCSLPVSLQELHAWGYNITKHSREKALQDNASTSSGSQRHVGGRPSKVSSESIIKLVGTTIEKYLKESERVAVVGRGTKKRMVLASHLTKKKQSIYFAESALHDAMGRETFRKIMKIHFPHVRNPRRMTDICASALLHVTFQDI